MVCIQKFYPTKLYALSKIHSLCKSRLKTNVINHNSSTDFHQSSWLFKPVSFKKDKSEKILFLSCCSPTKVLTQSILAISSIPVGPNWLNKEFEFEFYIVNTHSWKANLSIPSLLLRPIDNNRRGR